MALPYRCPVHVTSRSRDNAASADDVQITGREL